MLQCLPSSFGLIWHGLRGDVVWKNLRWSLWRPSLISEWNDFSSLNLCVTVMLPIKFWLNLTSGFGGDAVRRISRWWPSWLLKQKILAVLNFCVTVMPPIKFWLNPVCGLWGDIIWRISSWLPWPPSWILEQNDFSNSESLCHFPSSFISIGLLVCGEMLFEEFQDGRHGGHLGYRNGKSLAILNLHAATVPPTKFQLNPTWGSGDVENVKS